MSKVDNRQDGDASGYIHVMLFIFYLFILCGSGPLPGVSSCGALTWTVVCTPVVPLFSGHSVCPYSLGYATQIYGLWSVALRHRIGEEVVHVLGWDVVALMHTVQAVLGCVAAVDVGIWLATCFLPADVLLVDFGAGRVYKHKTAHKCI